MIQLIKSSTGKIHLDGDGTRVSISHLISKDLFNADEIRTDILAKRLILTHFEDAGYGELFEFVAGKSWDCNVIDRDNLQKYLEYKNDEYVRDKFQELKSELGSVYKLIQDQSEMIQHLSSQVMKDKEPVNNYVTIEEVGKLFPQYNINSIRNIVSKNKHFDDKLNLMRSWLQIGEFKLEFRKPRGTRKWIADRVRFMPERSKTFDDKFQQKLLKRLQHGVRYFFI